MAKDETTSKQITLSDGRIAVVVKGKGKDAKNALMKSEGKSEEFLALLMAELTTVDGQKLPQEEYEEMSMPDYLAIQTAFAEVNF